MIYILAIFLFLLASVLIFPVGIELDYSERGRRWYAIWMWLHIPVPDRFTRPRGETEKAEGKARRQQRAAERKAERPKRSIGEKISDMVDSMGRGLEMFESGLQALASITHHLRIRVHRLNVLLATSNPAMTGFACGMLYAAGGAIASSWPLVVEPDFMGTSSAVSFRVEARVTVIKLVPAAWRFVRRMRALRKEPPEDNQERKS